MSCLQPESALLFKPLQWYVTGNIVFQFWSFLSACEFSELRCCNHNWLEGRRSKWRRRWRWQVSRLSIFQKVLGDTWINRLRSCLFFHHAQSVVRTFSPTRLESMELGCRCGCTSGSSYNDHDSAVHLRSLMNDRLAPIDCLITVPAADNFHRFWWFLPSLETLFARTKIVLPIDL